MLDLLKNNLEKEIQIVNLLSSFQEKLKVRFGDDERKLIVNAIASLTMQLKMINSAIPELVNNVSFYKNLLEKPSANKNLVNVSYIEDNKSKSLVIKTKDKDTFLKNVALTQYVEKKLYAGEETIGPGLQSYITFSNKLFKKAASDLVEDGHFGYIKTDLKKITAPFLINTYVSMMFASVLLSFFAGLVLGIFLFILGVSLTFALIPLVLLPLIVGGLFIIYPSSRRGSLEKGINQELPFLTIYLAAISTSGIEPSKIFSILASTKDYPFSQREIKKLINYLNFYGYDLVSALRSISKTCPSERLGLLFDGLATTITSGGELTSFLNKHSETLLFDYRLEREKYTRLSETFMDIYISIIIAAPMILMMLFVLMSVTGFGSAMFSPQMLSLLVIMVISVLNMGFLLFLNVKQPKF